MNQSSQLSWTPGKCCAPRKWGVKGFSWISDSRLVPLIACTPSGAVGHKSSQHDPERDGSIIYTSSVDADGRSLNCNNAGASSSGLQALLFWHWLLVRYRSVNHGWKPCCESTAGVTHDDFDLCGTVHVQRAGKRVQKIWLKSMNLRLSTAEAASFFACLLFFLPRFDQTVVSLLSLLVCSAAILFQRQPEGRIPLHHTLLWIHRELRESSLDESTTARQRVKTEISVKQSWSIR